MRTGLSVQSEAPKQERPNHYGSDPYVLQLKSSEKGNMHRTAAPFSRFLPWGASVACFSLGALLVLPLPLCVP